MTEVGTIWLQGDERGGAECSLGEHCAREDRATLSENKDIWGRGFAPICLCCDTVALGYVKIEQVGAAHMMTHQSVKSSRLR